MSSKAASADRPSSSAPGKILVTGEYAVLDGAQAVIMAVNRRARATLADAPQELSPFLAAVRDLCGEPDRAARVVVDTGALASDNGPKLGLGSSAAATVAAVACAIGAGDRARVHDIAHRAHALAQAPRGARGSGADVAASVHGGVLVVRRDLQAGDDAPLAVQPARWPRGFAFVTAWTGAPADTPALVARVRALRADRPRDYDAIAARIAGASARLVDAIGDAGGAARAVDAIRDGGDAVAELGRAAGVALWTDAHTRIAAIAEPAGAAVKPTGAGGGDIALIVLSTPDSAASLRAELAAAGIPTLSLDVDPDGVL
jgi:phosphomevalonate kinase